MAAGWEKVAQFVLLFRLYQYLLPMKRTNLSALLLGAGTALGSILLLPTRAFAEREYHQVNPGQELTAKILKDGTELWAEAKPQNNRTEYGNAGALEGGSELWATEIREDEPEQAQNNRTERRAKRALEAERVARMTDSLLRVKRFLFVPTRVVTSLPGMPYATLNTYYELAVAGDSLVCSLPYYGYVYNTVYDPDKSPFFFSSTDFTYEIKGAPLGKQKAWVTITARELRSNREFVLTLEVFDNGSASLSLQGVGTQQLQFLGNIMPIPVLSGL